MRASAFVKRWLVAVALLVIVAGCGQAQEPIMEVPVMDPSMNKIPMRPVCVGRFQVDLPAQGRQEWSQSFDEARVYRLPSSIQTQEAFWGEVEGRKQELASQPHDTEDSLLSDFRRYGEKSAMLLYRTSEVDVYTYKVERYLWFDDWGYRFEGGIAAKDKRDVGRYLDIFERIRPRDNLEATSAPGFCIDGALVVGSVSRLSASVDVKIPGWKRVAIGVGSSEANPPPSEVVTRDAEESSVDAELKRTQEVNAIYAPHAGEIDTYPKEFDILRQHDRTVAGFVGREAVWRQKLNNGATLYNFVWHAVDHRQGPGGNLGGSISMDVGNEREPEVEAPSEEDLFTLWDAVLASARVR